MERPTWNRLYRTSADKVSPLSDDVPPSRAEVFPHPAPRLILKRRLADRSAALACASASHINIGTGHWPASPPGAHGVARINLGGGSKATNHIVASTSTATWSTYASRRMMHTR